MPVSSAWRQTAALVGGLTVAHLMVAAIAPLDPDEAYYRLWSLHPAFGYFDHPPMVAWWIRAGTLLAGDNAFGIRLLFVLSGLLTSLALYGTACRLFAERETALRAVLWFNVTLLAGAGGILATPDAPSVLFFTLGALALTQLRHSGNGAWWLAIGVAAGLGAVAKYTDLFLGLGILAWLLSSRDARHWLWSPWTWAGLLAAMLVALPTVLWNADHGWISFAKQFGRIGAGGAGGRYFFEFLGAQAALLNPLVALFLGLALWRRFRMPPGEARRAFDFLLALTAPLVLYMAFHALHDRVQGNWPAPVYPLLALIAATAADDLRRQWQQHCRRAVLPLGLGLAALGLTLLALPLDRMLPSDPARVLHGWDRLAEAAAGAAATNGAGWIATTHYGETGELAFALRGRLPVEPVEPVAEGERYDFLAPIPESLRQGPAILVVRQGRQIADACFGQLHPLGTVARTARDSYTLYLAEDPQAAAARGC